MAENFLWWKRSGKKRNILKLAMPHLRFGLQLLIYCCMHTTEFCSLYIVCISLKAFTGCYPTRNSNSGEKKKKLKIPHDGV